MIDDQPGTTPSMDRSYSGETDTDDATAARRRPIEVASSAARSGSLALLAGAYLGYRAARAAVRGHRRALPYAAVAGIAVRTGLRQRRGGEDSPEDFGIDAGRLGEPVADEGEKSTADDARSAIERQGTGRAPHSPGENGNDDVEEPAGDGSDGDVSFVDPNDPEMAPRSHPTGADRDPRRNAGDPVEVDVSDSAMADEPGEAVGPDPEQAQPTQTEGTEPDAEPDADPTHGTDDSDRDPESGAGGRLSEEGPDRDEDGDQLGQDETDLEPDATDERSDDSDAPGA